MLDFSNLSPKQIAVLTRSPYYELFSQVEEVSFIDVTTMMSKEYEEEFESLLIPNPERAIYVTGDIFPCLNFDEDEGYYSAELVRNIIAAAQEAIPKEKTTTVLDITRHGVIQNRRKFMALTSLSGYKPDIVMPQQVLAYEGDIYNAEGHRVLKKAHRRHAFLQTSSPYSQSLYMLIASSVIRTISSHLVLGKVHVSTPKPLDMFLTEKGLTHLGPKREDDNPEDDCRIGYDRAEMVYHDQLVQVDGLVKPYPFSSFKLWLQGLTFKLERGVDARILEYHRQLEEHLRSIQSDL